MKLSGIKAMTLKNLNQMKRDPRMIILSIVAPIIVTTLFGFVFGGELTHLKVYIVCDDENFDDVIGNDIALKIAENPKIQYNLSTSDPNLVINAVNENYTQGAIIIPSSFTEDLLLGNGAQISLYVSQENLNISNYVTGVFQTSFNSVIEGYFGDSQVDINIIPVHQGMYGPLPTYINISLSNLDEGWTHKKLSKALIDYFDENDTVDVEEADSVKKVKDSVKNGEARAIIIIPKSFTYDALVKKEINIDVKLDGAEPQACAAIKGVISYYLAEVFEETYDKSSFNIDEYYYNNPDSDEEPIEPVTYFTPAILGFVTFFFAFLLTMLSFLRERKQGTMERLLTSPLKRDEIIIGYVFSFSLLAVIQASVVLFTTIVLFNAQIDYSFLALTQAFLIIYVVVLGALGIGIFLSTLAKTEFQIIQFIPLIIMPFMLLSGVWAPVETLPEGLQVISKFIPLTYSNNMMRDILIRRETIFDVIVPFLILCGFAALTITLGVLKLSTKIK